VKQTVKFSVPLLVITGLLVALSTVRVFPLGLDLAFSAMSHQLVNARPMFVIHITAASLALVFGSIQIISALRNRHLKVHRWVGRLYALAVLFGGISGFLIAFQIDGVIGTSGFALLAVFWLFTTTQGVRMARAHLVQAHLRWMTYSVALTFAAVSLRLQLLIFAVGLEMPYHQVYPFLAWSCWVPSIAFALWYVSRSIDQ
jgi:uncharacterized membrane protein